MHRGARRVSAARGMWLWLLPSVAEMLQWCWVDELSTSVISTKHQDVLLLLQAFSSAHLRWGRGSACSRTSPRRHPGLNG